MRKTIVICAVLCALAGAARAQKVEIIMATLAPTGFGMVQGDGEHGRRVEEDLGRQCDPVDPRRRRGGRRPRRRTQAALRLHTGRGPDQRGPGRYRPGRGGPPDPHDVRQLRGSWITCATAWPPKLEKRIEDKGYLVLNWGDAGWVQFFSTKPVHRLDDLRKLKLFTWAGYPTEEDLWKANGFRVVPLASTDIVQQLETHGIEAVPTTALIAETAQIYKLAGYMCDVKWAPLLGATVVSKTTWERIPAAQRGPMLAAARKSGRP